MLSICTRHWTASAKESTRSLFVRNNNSQGPGAPIDRYQVYNFIQNLFARLFLSLKYIVITDPQTIALARWRGHGNQTDSHRFG